MRERKGTRRLGLRVLPRSHTVVHHGAKYLPSSTSSTIVVPLSSYVTRWVMGTFGGDVGEAAAIGGERPPFSEEGCQVEGCRQG
jgi:hypothetical protein